MEHAEMLDDDLVARLAALSITASVQPLFDALWGGSPGMYATRLGVDRARTLNPFAALSRAGVPLAFGSDAPVTPIGGWEACVRRRTTAPPSTRSPWRTLQAHTVGGWRAAKSRRRRTDRRRCSGPPRCLGRQASSTTAGRT